MEFKSKVLEFTYNGKQQRVNYPKIKDIEFLQRDMKDKEPDMKQTLDFLERLGLKKEDAMDMEVEHLKTIVDTLSGAEKK